MMKPENTFIGSVHKHLSENVYRMKNNNQYNSGIADVWYSGPARDLWVEYKFIKVPARQDTVIDIALSELQKKWLIDRHNEGRNVAVIVGSKDGGVYFPNISWSFQPYNAKFFREAMVPRKTLADIISGFSGG